MGCAVYARYCNDTSCRSVHPVLRASLTIQQCPLIIFALSDEATDEELDEGEEDAMEEDPHDQGAFEEEEEEEVIMMLSR
jgi:hypothetical protein